MNRAQTSRRMRMSRELVKKNIFHQLDKDVGILSVKMDTVQGSVKRLETDVKEVAKKL
ncbi:Protein of unknown function [Pyronema omphalodes CBS 100304]|uniref:Uncharacterized protein n=1 Tax=Pyronema omphalodes (strain CBS 100304) TaxID=1076935 RepID=U4LLZ3_PYROM|nr:Protein of unknown function [Pyronema omphalodes CBS 100304]